MEPEELKELWNQYDKKLTENLRLNEELLRKMNLDKSKREMDTPLNYEIFNSIGGLIFLLLTVSATIRLSGEPKFFIPALFSCLIMLLMGYFSLHRLKMLTDIDYYHSSVVELQKALAKVKQKYLLYKRIELLSFPLLAVFLSPVIVKVLRHGNLYDHMTQYGIGILLALGLGYPMMIWIYKNWYEKKFKNASDFLKELDRFEQE